MIKQWIKNSYFVGSIEMGTIETSTRGKNCFVYLKWLRYGIRMENVQSAMDFIQVSVDSFLDRLNDKIVEDNR